MLDIQAFYKEILGLTDENVIQTLVSSSKVFFAQKGETIQNIGDIATHVYFLENGLLRGFFFDFNGREVTDCFAFNPGTPAIASLDLANREPVCIDCIEALEDSTLIAIPFNVVYPLLKSNLDIISLYNRLLVTSLMRHWEIKIMLAQHTATERYSWFLQNFPGLIDRASHKHIASFLGITPVQLSRIRRVIREKLID